MEKKLWIFFSIVFLSMATEHSITPICPKGALISFLHHILSTFMILSPFMFKEYQLQILLTFLIWLSWKVTQGKCVTTIKYNEICKKGEDAKFMNLQGVLTQETGLNWSYVIAVPTLLFSFYKLCIHSS
tara:strand:- start:19043 stop:19429 length:387 start_codon:yes stop_codon:yes gene_type:complete